MKNIQKKNGQDGVPCQLESVPFFRERFLYFDKYFHTQQEHVLHLRERILQRSIVF